MLKHKELFVCLLTKYFQVKIIMGNERKEAMCLKVLLHATKLTKRKLHLHMLLTTICSSR